MPVTTVFRPRATQWLLLLLILTVTGVPPVTARQASPVATPVTEEQLAAVLPEWRDELSAVIDGVSARYTIEAEATLPEGTTPAPTVTGTMTMTFTNTTGESLPDLPFRLYANAGKDGLRVSHVTVGGAPVETAQSGDGSIVTVPLAEPLTPGGSVTIGMSFVTTVPVNERNHYGIFNYDTGPRTWALAHWYPILAGWDPDRGFVLDPPSENGDPIFSTTATYDVTMRAPAKWRTVTTGVEVERSEQNGIGERRFVSGPARDFTVVLDDDFEVAEQVVGGTTISSWHNPGEERSGEAAAEYAAQAVAFFNELIGPYPYTTLDIVPVELFGAAGVEFPQLFYMSSSYYRAYENLAIPNSFDFTIAHEVLHSWWYDMVGNNHYDHAFIDEGLTNYMSATLYHRELYGPEVGEIMTERYLTAPFDSTVRSGNDQVVDTPTDDFPSGGAYVFAAYTKAPLGFMAIHEEIGDEAFDGAVTTYFYDNWFTVASPDDLLAAFEEAAGRDLDELWAHWFEETSGEEDV